MYVMEGHAGSQNQTLYIVLLIVLVTMSLVFGQSELHDPGIIKPEHLNKYLSCYRCLFETKELGCLLGSDTCLVPKGSSCMTLLIRNKFMAGDSLAFPDPVQFRGSAFLGSRVGYVVSDDSGFETMVSDCRSKEQMSDCSYTRASPVFGFWIFSRCCFQNFCNNPQNRMTYIS